MQADNFFQSETDAVLRTVRTFEIHGAKFYEIGFSFPEDPAGTIRRTRISDNLIYADPKPEDRVKIAILMGNVARVAKV